MGVLTPYAVGTERGLLRQRLHQAARLLGARPGARRRLHDRLSRDHREVAGVSRCLVRAASRPSGPPTRALAEVLASTRYGDLPADVVEHTRRSITDWLGSALGGSIEKPARLAQQIAAGFGASDHATMFGAGRGRPWRRRSPTVWRRTSSSSTTFTRDRPFTPPRRSSPRRWRSPSVSTRTAVRSSPQ